MTFVERFGYAAGAVGVYVILLNIFGRSLPSIPVGVVFIVISFGVALIRSLMEEL